MLSLPKVIIDSFERSDLCFDAYLGDIYSRKSVVIVGHSACGKSTIANLLNLERAIHDMDLFLLTNQLMPSVDSFKKFVDQKVMIPLFILANDADLLSNIPTVKDELCLFVYIKRPPEIIFDYLKQVNADGQRHIEIPYEKYLLQYASFDIKFTNIAHTIIRYEDRGIERLANAFRSAFSFLI